MSIIALMNALVEFEYLKAAFICKSKAFCLPLNTLYINVLKNYSP